MKKETFLSLVLASVLELKANATPEELAKLDFATLQPTKGENCILGQIAGDSKNERALELAKKTIGVNVQILKDLEAKNVYLGKQGIWGLTTISENAFESFTTETVDDVSLEANGMLAPFEIFLMCEGANNEELIQFLKGERETFEPRIEAVVTEQV